MNEENKASFRVLKNIGDFIRWSVKAKCDEKTIKRGLGVEGRIAVKKSNKIQKAFLGTLRVFEDYLLENYIVKFTEISK